MTFFKHLWVLTGILCYSGALASFVLEQQGPVAVGLLALLFYPFLMSGWLFYASFQVVQKTYRAWATATLLVGAGFLWLAGSTHGSPVDLWVLIRDYVLLWSPLFFLGWHLVRGFLLSCPRCSAVDGLYARRVTRREHLGTRSVTTMQTSSRTTHYGNHTVTERTTQPVTRHYSTYRLYCACSVCHHTWTTTETESG